MCRCLAGRLSAFLLSCGCSGLLCGVMLPGGCRGLALSMLARRLWPPSSLRPSWPSSPGLPNSVVWLIVVVVTSGYGRVVTCYGRVAFWRLGPSWGLVCRG